MNDDAQLLRRYAEHASESTFAELVARHIDLVYSAALRQEKEHQAQLASKNARLREALANSLPSSRRNRKSKQPNQKYCPLCNSKTRRCPMLS